MIWSLPNPGNLLLINCGNRFWIWKRQVPPIHCKARRRLADTRPDYERFVQLLETEQQRELLGKALDNLYQPWLQNGVLEQLGHSKRKVGLIRFKSVESNLVLMSL